MEIRNIKIYQTTEGKEPYREWFLKLDNSQKAVVSTRLKRVECGNYGYYQTLSGEINELKFDSGLRIYFAEIDKVIVLLLTGGGKKRQSNDIKKAQEFYNDYINRSKKND